MRRSLAALVFVAEVVGSMVLAAPVVRGQEAPLGVADVDAAALRPDIVWRPIPFGARRRRQTAGYSSRHYGERTWQLTAPAVIVEHYTDGPSFSSAWSTFASNSRHLGELPGTCAHFVIDTDGTIYQLVRLRIRCRHVVGLNSTSIGIEHVGTSDRQVLGNRRQMRSSLRLTVWLMARFDVNVGNVIGHAEALESPYHFELYRTWRCLVHSDFPHRAMREYRHRLRDAVRAAGFRGGPGPVWVDSGC